MCLMQLKKYERAISMFEQALKIKKVSKSLIRKSQCHIEQGDFEKANQTVKELEELAQTDDDKKLLQNEIKKLRAEMNKSSKTEEAFSKNIFSGNLYNEKENLPTKEEEEK